MTNRELAQLIRLATSLTCAALNGPPRWREPALRAAWSLLSGVATR